MATWNSSMLISEDMRRLMAPLLARHQRGPQQQGPQQDPQQQQQQQQPLMKLNAVLFHLAD